jgi:hypothetical protein
MAKDSWLQQQIEGCKNYAKQGGVCWSHGGAKKRNAATKKKAAAGISHISSMLIIAGTVLAAYHILTPAAATSCHIISVRQEFPQMKIFGRSTISRSRRNMFVGTNKALAAATDIKTVGLRKKIKSKKIDLDDNFDYNYNEQQSEIQLQQQQPSLDELRAQLGPIGLLVSNTIELTIVTLGSYISGGLLGYFGGGIMNIPSILFGKSMGNLSQRLSALNSKAFATFKTWGVLSAAFSGFNNFVRMCRGDVNDGWNTVFGSALTGAFLSRDGGVQAMLQGAATYAVFTYFLDKMTRSQDASQQSNELMYTDVPVDDIDE